MQRSCQNHRSIVKMCHGNNLREQPITWRGSLAEVNAVTLTASFTQFDTLRTEISLPAKRLKPAVDLGDRTEIQAGPGCERSNCVRR
jgi:hypothetical protein